MPQVIRQSALVAGVLVALGGLGGCPPTPQPIPPLAHTGAATTEPAPAVGTLPPGDAYMPVDSAVPLTGEVLARANFTPGQVDEAAQKAARTLGVVQTKPAPATGAATAPDSPPQAVRYYLQGRQKFLEGSKTEALAALDQSLRIDPNAFAVLRLMGRVCFASNQLARGSLYLQRAAATHPDDVEVNYLLGRYWLERQEWNTAIYYLLRARRSPEMAAGTAFYPLVGFYLGRAQQGAGYLQQAAEQYEAFLTAISEPRPAYRYDRELNYLIDQAWAVELAAAECFAVTGQADRALPHYQAAAGHQPGSAYIAARVVVTQARLGAFPAAISGALNVVSLAKGSDDSIQLLLWVYRRAGLESRMVPDLEMRSSSAADGALATLALAGAQQKLGQKDAAVATLLRYLHARPADLPIVQRVVTLCKPTDTVVPAFGALAASLRAGVEDKEVLRLLWELFGQPPQKSALAAVRQAFPPENSAPETHYLMALLYAAAGDDVQSAGLLQRALAAQPAFWAAREAYVNLLVRQEQFAKAQKVAQEAMALQQGGVQARRLMIESEVAQERYADALKLAGDAVVEFPNNPEVRLLLAAIYQVRDQPADAARTLRELIVRFPKFEVAYERLITLNLSMEERDRALESLAQLLREVPGSHFGLALSALYYAENGQADEAAQVADRLLADHPGDPGVVVDVAAIRQKLGKADDAIKLLQDYLRHNKPEATVVGALAQDYEESGRKDDSLALYEKCYKDNPDAAFWLVQYGAALARHERNNDAEALLRQGLARFPAAPEVCDALAGFLAANERSGEAATLIRGFMDRQGETVPRLYRLAMFLEEAGQHDKSVVELQRILQIMPDHSGANNDLGYFWADHGTHLDQAREMIERALRNEPNNPAYLDSMGWVYYKQGQFAKSVEVLTHAVSYPKGQEAEGVAHLADALYRAGRRDEARERYEQAKALLEESRPALRKSPVATHILNAVRQFKEGTPVETAPVGKAE